MSLKQEVEKEIRFLEKEIDDMNKKRDQRVDALRREMVALKKILKRMEP